MTGPARILVTGSRTWTNRERMATILRSANPDGTATIVHGACPNGADEIADEIARLEGWLIERHPADWTIGKHAGYLRNADMVYRGADLCVAFIVDGSKGASHCARLAEFTGIPVLRIEVTT